MGANLRGVPYMALPGSVFTTMSDFVKIGCVYVYCGPN